MKKHVSLFLALLMLFSALFALPAEAAQLEQIQNEQSYDSTDVDSIRSQVSAPRTTDLDVPSNRTVLAGGIGNEITAACSHTYKNLQYNASQHKKVCTKCGYTTYAAHTIKYASQSATQHKKLCTVCGYSAVVSHNIKYQNCGNTHQKYCSLCDYTTGETHSFKYTDSGNKHRKSCKCGYSVQESHINSSIVGKSESSHVFICTKCNHVTQESHTWGYSYNWDPVYHSKYCTICQYCAGRETHDFYEWIKGGFDANGIPFCAKWKCRACGKIIDGPMPDPGVH